MNGLEASARLLVLKNDEESGVFVSERERPCRVGVFGGYAICVWGERGEGVVMGFRRWRWFRLRARKKRRCMEGARHVRVQRVTAYDAPARVSRVVVTCAASGTPAYSALASLSTSATVLLPNGFQLAFQAFWTVLACFYLGSQRYTNTSQS